MEVEERNQVTELLELEKAERKNAEEQIHTQSGFLRYVLESFPHQFYLIDANDYTVKMSNKAGHGEISLETTTCYALTHKRDKPCIGSEHICPLERVKETKEPVTVEHIHSDNDGNPIIAEVHGFPVFDASGNLIQMIEYSIDISERKKAEEELRQLKGDLEKRVEERTTTLAASEERFRTVFEDALMGILVVDEKGKINQINRAFKEMLGYNDGELLGKKFSDITHPDDAEKNLMLFNRILEGTLKDYRMEKRYLRKDGSTMWATLAVSAVYDEKGKYTYSFGMVEDITGRKTVEEQIKKRVMKFQVDEGKVYLVKEPVADLSIGAFKDALNISPHGVIVSRTPGRELNIDPARENIDFMWLAENGGKKALSPIAENIELLIGNLPRRAVVLIDRLDYVLSINGYEKTLSLVQHLREAAFLNDLMIIMSIDPSTLEKKELRQLAKECHQIELKHKGRLPDSLLDILKFVYKKNTLGIKPSKTSVELKLGISRPTLIKRINQLTTDGYLKESVKGREKILVVTEKGDANFTR